MMQFQRSGAAAFAVLAYVGITNGAWAQQEVAPALVDVAPTGGSPTDRVSYGPDFFARYQINNAEDMLRLVPGVQAILNEGSNAQQRGFGSGGAQILLNGKRFPGKSNEITGNLRRIPAASVARVELISGAASDISVQSEGLLVNVVLKEGASLGGSGSWELNAKFNDEQGQTQFDGLLSYKNSIGALSYNLGVERNMWSPSAQGGSRWTTRTREETFYYANGAIQEYRPQDWDRDHEKWTYTSGLSYNFNDGSRADLNGLYETRNVYQDDIAYFTTFSQAGAITAQGQDIHSQTTVPADTVEISGQYARTILGGDLQLLAIATRGRNNVIDFRNRQTATDFRELNRTDSDQDTSEDILRATFTFPLVQGQTLQIGGESAKNVLEQRLLAFFDSDANGVLETTPAQRAHVEEKRGEIFVTHNWTITKALSLESGLNYEMSAISSNYVTAGFSTVTPERELGFLKPRFDLRYRVNQAEQWRVLVERTVSQLDFNNFVPRLNFSDNILTEGNPNLEPQKTWNYEIGYERRLPSDAGLIEARVFYNDITDALARVPIVGPTGAIIAVQGNVGSAYAYGAEVKGSIRLGFIGLRDSLLSATYLRRESEIEDQFTLLDKRLYGKYNLDVSYRQDLPAWGASFGFSYKEMAKGDPSTDLIGGSIAASIMTIEPYYETFVEKNLFGATVLRVEIQNFGGSPERRFRYFTPLANPSGPVQRYDSFEEDRDLRVALRLRGRF